MSEDEALYSPDDYLEYVARCRGVSKEALRIPNRLILVYQTFAFEHIKKILDGKIIKWLYSEQKRFSVGVVDGKEIGVFRSWIGAPAAALSLENLIACGAEKIFEVGLAGGLHPSLKLGDVVVVTEAIRDEGTSNHYFSPEVKLESSLKLRNLIIQEITCKGIEYLVGPVWTTDGVYRETRGKFLKFCDQGALAVNMETSALFAVAKYRNVEIASAQVISDVLTTKGWLFAFRDEEVMSELQILLEVAVKALAKA